MNYIEKSGKRALLDFEDSIRILTSGAWINFTSSGYVMLKERNNRKGGFHYLHRWVLGAPKGSCVDHINGDKLDNRRVNLRITTQGMNRANSIKSSRGNNPYKGVCFQRNRWRARVVKDGREYHCGYYRTPEEAAKAYDKKALELFGEYANLNFKQED